MEDDCWKMKGREMRWGGKMSVEMSNSLPVLNHLKQLLRTYESYYHLLSGSDACSVNVAEVLWNGTCGFMNHLKSSRITEDTIMKASNFLDSWSLTWKKNLLDHVYQEICELRGRLEAALEYKRNSEDPLGW